MEIRINHLIEGAKQAEGLVVIIDVFRAFSLECWLYAMGAKEIRPVGAIEDALSWREKDPEAVLIGERHGRKLDGFDFGNSPSTVDPEAIRGKRIIHTTSAGTQELIFMYAYETQTIVVDCAETEQIVFKAGYYPMIKDIKIAGSDGVVEIQSGVPSSKSLN